MKQTPFGFTLIEILVVITIVSLLSAVIYGSFGDARESSRDKIRKTSLKELGLALELYKAQTGVYPPSGCLATGWAGPGPQTGLDTSCTRYIEKITPGYIDELPTDPNQESEPSRGFMYRVSPEGDRYKLMVQGSVETELVDDFDNEFARCPSAIVGSPCATGAPNRTYAIYSAGAEAW